MKNLKCGEISAICEPRILLLQEIDEHRVTFEATAEILSQSFQDMVDILAVAVRQGGKILLFGNGGSAADAQHIAAELIIRYKADRAPIAALALSTDTSALTACANDMGFEAVFERQVEGLGKKGDVAIGLSTSGNSANVLRGLAKARAGGLRTIGLSGFDGGKMAAVCDVLFIVPSSVTARIQEMHIMIGHMVCKVLERRLGLA